MKIQGRSLIQACTLLVAGALATGCAVVPAPEPAVTVYAPIAPPPPRVEVVPALPYPGAVWIGGYWGWYGGRHVWVPGYYARPRPGYHWQPYRWAPYPRQGWGLYGGHWAR